LIVEQHGTTRRLDVDRAFVDLGLVAHSGLVQGLVATDRNGFIVVDACSQTTVPGLFAAGDVTTTLCEQVLIAVGDGTRAAMHAYDYLLGRGLHHAGAAP
jgi:alkyl hydroperoxide reductase subunit AhpF